MTKTEETFHPKLFFFYQTHSVIKVLRRFDYRFWVVDFVHTSCVTRADDAIWASSILMIVFLHTRLCHSCVIWEGVHSIVTMGQQLLSLRCLLRSNNHLSMAAKPHPTSFPGSSLFELPLSRLGNVDGFNPNSESVVGFCQTLGAYSPGTRL